MREKAIFSHFIKVFGITADLPAFVQKLCKNGAFITISSLFMPKNRFGCRFPAQHG
jgi:hypothetical protein